MLLLVSAEALKVLRSAPPAARVQINGLIREAMNNPKAGDPTKLTGALPGDRRLRAGQWQIVFGVKDDVLTVRLVVNVIPL